MENKKVIMSVVVCVVIAVLSFLGGMSYGKGKNNTISTRQGSYSQNGFNQGGYLKGAQGMRSGRSGGMMNGGGFTSGEIISKDDKSMTIKLRDGGSKIVLFGASAKVEKTVDGSIADVSVGKSVMVTGTTNSDGSISATSIQMRPAFPAIAPSKTN